MPVRRLIAGGVVLLGLLVSAAGAASATTALHHKPVLSALQVTPSAIRLGAPGPPATVITFRLSRPTNVRLSFANAGASAASAGSCPPPGTACIHYVTGGSLRVKGRSGANAVLFNGFFPPGTALAPGTYTLTATPIDGTHGVGIPRSVRLTVLTGRLSFRPPVP